MRDDDATTKRRKPREMRRDNARCGLWVVIGRFELRNDNKTKETETVRARYREARTSTVQYLYALDYVVVARIGSVLCILKKCLV
jgi:hypothetical protein